MKNTIITLTESMSSRGLVLVEFYENNGTQFIQETYKFPGSCNWALGSINELLETKAVDVRLEETRAYARANPRGDVFPLYVG